MNEKREKRSAIREKVREKHIKIKMAKNWKKYRKRGVSKKQLQNKIINTKKEKTARQEKEQT